MKSNLALKLNEDSPKLEPYIVYFGGKSPGIAEEVKEISSRLMNENASNIFYGSSGIIIPVFELLHARLGLMTNNVEEMVKKSHAYVEIIGEGFGDTSFDLAYHAYKTAKIWKLPVGVLLKKKRNHNPKHANSFLELFEENITIPRLVIPYDSPSDVAAKVNDFLKQIFKI